MTATLGYYITETSDTAKMHRAFLARGRAAERSLTAELTPSRNRPRSLAGDLERAAGREHASTRGSSVDSALRWQLIHLWSVIDDLDHIFIARANHLNAGEIAQVAGLACACQATLWLSCQGRPPVGPKLTAMRGWGLEPMSWKSFSRRWSEPTSPTPSIAVHAVPGSDLPELPEEPVLLWSSTCDEVLGPEDARRVRRMFLAELKSAHAALATWDRTVVSLAEILRTAFSTYEARPLITLRLRAWEAAGLLCGAEFDGDIDALCTKDRGRSADAINDELIERLSGIPNAFVPAMILAHLIGPASSSQLRALLMSALTPDASSLTVDAATQDVPLLARRLLRAHRLARRADGASEGDPLFARRHYPADDPSQLASPGTAQRTIVAANREHALQLLSARNRHSSNETARAWAQRMGFSFQTQTIERL